MTNAQPNSVSDSPIEEVIKLNSIEEAVADIKAGKVIIVVDDEDRENEGDFICAAECITPEIVNFMATHGRGLICTPIDERRADELNLNMMVQNNTDMHQTAFTVSIDLKGRGCTTGISAYDRATCIKALVDPSIKAEDFGRPGHIFPLRAKPGGVLRRTGHTEAAIDLAKMAGFFPAGVLVEILNEDGTMARLPQLKKIAEKFDLKMIAIKDLVEYRLQTESLVRKELTVPVETQYGKVLIHAFSQLTTGDTHLAIQVGEWEEEEPVLVRVYSDAAASNALGNLFGNYSAYFHESMQKIAAEGKGLILNMRNKEEEVSILQTLQNVLETTRQSGNPKDVVRPTMEQRDYGVGAQIIRELGVSKMRLLTNNPRSRVGMVGFGLEVVENVSL
ncbi:MAG: 3,4-dihydroxy-2-butanone-4-phosphate synthase [Saprospiraceae bacterium]